MKFKVTHGAELDVLTPDEAARLFAAAVAEGRPVRVRAPAIIELNATGDGEGIAYEVPTGFEFEARRVVLDLNTASDPTTGAVALNAAGKSVAYRRSGSRIEYAETTYGANVQVPGAQTWGQEQGPYLRNGETFEVVARGLTANAKLSVMVEGVLQRGQAKP